MSLYSINFHPSLCIPRQPLQWWYVVHQFCHALVMMEIDFTGFAITVLGYDDDTQAIGGISTLLIDGLAVEGRAAKQHYHIRILLYGAAVAQVAQGGAMVYATVARPVQLTQQQYGDIQLLGQQLCLAACLRHFLLAVAVFLVTPHVT